MQLVLLLRASIAQPAFRRREIAVENKAIHEGPPLFEQREQAWNVPSPGIRIERLLPLLGDPLSAASARFSRMRDVHTAETPDIDVYPVIISVLVSVLVAILQRRNRKGRTLRYSIISRSSANRDGIQREWNDHHKF
jgi:hypothetical protein